MFCDVWLATDLPGEITMKRCRRSGLRCPRRSRWQSAPSARGCQSSKYDELRCFAPSAYWHVQVGCNRETSAMRWNTRLVLSSFPGPSWFESARNRICLPAATWFWICLRWNEIEGLVVKLLISRGTHQKNSLENLNTSEWVEFPMSCDEICENVEMQRLLGGIFSVAEIWNNFFTKISQRTSATTSTALSAFGTEMG